MSTHKSVYNKEYVDRYKTYEELESGKKINQARFDFVSTHVPLGATGLDIGVGAGTFMNTMNEHERYHWLGFDINPIMIKKMKKENYFLDMYKNQDSNVSVFTFWDSFEHIKDLSKVFPVLPQWVFMSIPIFKDADHAAQSKHYRKDEHFWYFTEQGLVNLFARNGYTLVEANMMESELGREGIGSFAFKKV